MSRQGIGTCLKFNFCEQKDFKMYPRPKPYEHRKNYTIPFEIFRGGGVSPNVYSLSWGPQKLGSVKSIRPVRVEEDLSANQHSTLGKRPNYLTKRGQRLGMDLEFDFCLSSKFKVLLHASVVLSGPASIIEGEIKEMLIAMDSKQILSQIHFTI